MLRQLAKRAADNLMDTLNLKPSSKAVTTYYRELEAYARLGVKHEMAVRDAFVRHPAL